MGKFALARITTLGAIFFSFCLIAFGAHHEEISVGKLPKPLKEAFDKAYPYTKITRIVRGISEGQELYEIKLADHGQISEVSYHADGQLVATERTVPISKLPTSINTAIEKKYPNSSKTRAERITKATGEIIEVKLLTATHKKVEARFDSSGKFLSEKYL